MTKNKLTIREQDEETVLISLNGEEVGRLTHAVLGWEGMDYMERTIAVLAMKLGAEVEIDNGEDE